MRSTSIIKFVMLLIVLFSALLLQGQNLEYRVEKPAKLYVGTPFRFNIEIETALKDSIFAPQLDTLDVFIRTGEIIQSEEIVEDQKISHLTLTFQGFDTGEFTFPELEFLVESEDGSTEKLKTNAFLVNIESTISDSSQIIKDIAAPVKISFSLWDYLLPIVILGLLITAIIMLKRYLKKGPEEEIVRVVKDSRPAWQICLEMLSKLEKEDLLGKGDFLEFYYRLSIVLRYFIELHYDFKAVEMTTSEIRQGLKLSDHKEKSKIMEILSFSDRVKFAKFAPTYKDSEANFNWLKEYLKSFKNQVKTEEETNA